MKNGIHKMPTKTHEVLNHHMDSTIWNDVKFRPDDIIISTYGKSGTTWVQQIVSQLIHQGDPNIPSGTVSPWVDMRVVPREHMFQIIERQTHRRFMKTHLPRDAMIWDPKVKYLFIGRDGRDMTWSMHHHFSVATPAFYAMLAANYDGPVVERPSENPRDMFVDLIEDDTRNTICWPFWSHIRSWWAARDQPNILFLHFNDLRADLEGEIRRIAKFLEIPEMPEDNFKAAMEHCTFQWMKEHAELSSPPGSDIAFENGAKDFINKGTNCRWKDVLSEEDNRRYMEKAKQELGDECANWLQNGGARTSFCNQ